MRNRAKCKLCGDVLESYHQHDLVSCKCGEISISGGNYEFLCSAKDFNNFLRIDDKDNTVSVKVVSKEDEPKHEEESTPVVSKKEKIAMLERMAQDVERLPSEALSLPITHYDFYSALLLLSSILRED